MQNVAFCNVLAYSTLPHTTASRAQTGKTALTAAALAAGNNAETHYRNKQIL